MHFAVALPWWALALLVLAVGVVAWGAYADVLAPLGRARRTALITLRALTLLLLVACLLRPVQMVPPEATRDVVVPILIDTSRSMQVPDAEGRRRIDVAGDLGRDLASRVAARFTPELWTFGDGLTRVAEGGVPASADRRRSDLAEALTAVSEHYRDRSLAGVIVISDGGDTSPSDAAAAVAGSLVPVHTIGVGRSDIDDLEVAGVFAGEVAFAGSSVDLTVAVVNRASAAPFDVRVLENGRPVDSRRVTPEAAGAPVRTVFTVSPSPDVATVYTVEIPSSSTEPVRENNRRSVLVEPPGRKRRLLMIEGAPAFEHSFLKRALALDASLETDSVVRKGRDADGRPTFLVQAPADRASLLASGFPQDRGALYHYDAVILANIEPETFSSDDFQLVADFVVERGGGLLMLGARTFAGQGLAGTPLEDVFPVGLADRGNGVIRAVSASPNPFVVSVTEDGASHPVMRVGATPEDSARRWAAVPSLSSAATLGAPRPGAQVLAVVRTQDGPRPLVAVQRVGRGRSMVFTGEASWRWRMHMPSDDDTYDLFWRQVGRWLAGASLDTVSIAAPSGAVPGDTGLVTVTVRDREFSAVSDGQVSLRVTGPDGQTRDAPLVSSDPRAGLYTSDLKMDEPGVYRFVADARRGGVSIGSKQRFALVGGADVELADPRLNEDVLRRVARASGGTYVSSLEAGGVVSLLTDPTLAPATPRVRELWQTPWVFLILVVLLSCEWALRRQWGLK